MKNLKQSQPRQRLARVVIRTSLIRPRDKQGDTLEEKRKNSEMALSPQTQLDEGVEYCNRNGIEVDKDISLAYADLDVSGSKILWRQRPNLIKHFEDAKKGLFTDLVFYKIARAGRNLKDSLDLVESFEELNIAVHFIKEQVDSSTNTGRLNRHMLMSVAEWQSNDLSSTIQDTIIARAKRGDITGRYPLMWLHRSENGQYEVIQEMKNTIHRMIDLRMDGFGYSKIANALNNEGYRTVKRRLWRDGAIVKYLSPSYIDSMCGMAFLYRDLPDDDPRRVVISDALPRILDDERANALRLLQKQNKIEPMVSGIPGSGNWKTNLVRAGRYRADSKYLLAGILHCPVCSARLLSMQHAHDRPSVRSYECPHAAAFSQGHKGPAGHSINADSLEDGVLRVVRQVLQTPPSSEKRPMRKKPARNTETIKKEMDILVDMRMKEIVQEDIYTRKYHILQTELSALQSAELEANTPDINSISTALSLQNSEISNSQLRQLILMLVERVNAPIVIPGVFVRGDKTGLRRHARVTMKFADASGTTTWMVPLYLPRFKAIKDPAFPVQESIGK